MPIVILTTESNDEFKRKARAAGATAWITKPFKPNQIVGVLSRLLPD